MTDFTFPDHVTQQTYCNNTNLCIHALMLQFDTGQLLKDTLFGGDLTFKCNNNVDVATVDFYLSNGKRFFFSIGLFIVENICR